MILPLTSIQTSQTVKRIDKSDGKRNDIVVPASVVNPGAEHKLGVLVSRRTRHDRHQNHEPANLEVEEGEAVETRDDLVAEKHNRCCRQIEALVDDEDGPCLEYQVRVIEGDQCAQSLGVDEVRGSSRENPYAYQMMLDA